LLAAEIAQDAAPPAAAADGKQAEPVGGLGTFLPAMIGVIALYYFLFIRPDRKRHSEQKSQLDALKKNDRVLTIGGIYGVVVNCDRQADEVTLKIDEATNTKIRVTFGSIARVVGGESSSAKSDN